MKKPVERVFTGTPGYMVMTVAALFAFITTVNAGIMSASRYPLALSRDKLLPEAISTIHRRFQTPVISICLTGIFIMLVLFLRLEEHHDVKAVFIILGTKDERNLHLKALAAIAQIIQEEGFENSWMQARNEDQLRDILLLSQRKRLRANTT
jgi:amino acid transporter